MHAYPYVYVAACNPSRAGSSRQFLEPAVWLDFAQASLKVSRLLTWTDFGLDFFPILGLEITKFRFNLSCMQQQLNHCQQLLLGIVRNECDQDDFIRGRDANRHGAIHCCGWEQREPRYPSCWWEAKTPCSKLLQQKELSLAPHHHHQCQRT